MFKSFYSVKSFVLSHSMLVILTWTSISIWSFWSVDQSLFLAKGWVCLLQCEQQKMWQCVPLYSYLPPQLGPEVPSLSDTDVKWGTPNFMNFFLPQSLSKSSQLLNKSHSCYVNLVSPFMLCQVPKFWTCDHRDIVAAVNTKTKSYVSFFNTIVTLNGL